MNPEVELRLTADLDDAAREVAGFRKEFGRLVQEVEKPLRQVNSFRDVGQSLVGTQRQIAATKDRLRQLRDELVRSEAPSKELQADYRNVTTELRRLERQELAQIGQLRNLREELQGAGVDVGNLAAEQRRLSAEFNSRMDAGRSDAALTAARNALGVGEIETAQRKLVELRQQYQLVTRDGNLSARERAEAESRYRRNVGETLSRLRDLREQTQRQATAEEREAAAQARRYAQAKQGVAQLAAAQRRAGVEARLAAAERARDNLGINQARAAEQEIAGLRQQYELLRRSGSLTTKELAIAQAQLKRRVAETKAELKGMSGGGGGAALSGAASEIPGLSRVSGGGASAAAAAGVAALGAAALQVGTGADEVGRLDSRLRLATRSQGEFNTAQVELDRIADRTQGDVADLIGLYSRLQRPMRDAGLDQQATLETIEAVSLGLKIGGASAEESASVIQQFSQAISSGVLRGEEFNAVLEGSDRIAGALADSLGVTIGQLREMAANGELTAEQVTNALRKELPKLRQEMDSFAPEIGAGFRRIFTETRRYWGRYAKESGAADAIAGALNDVAKSINGANNLIKKGDSDLTESMRQESASRQEILKQEKANTEQARKELLSSLNQAISDQRSLLARANSELLAARKQQESIAAEFRAAAAEFGSAAGGAGEADFGAVTAAKATARQKLQQGDTEGAVAEARKAIEILRQLRASDGNEYGFEGVAKELEAIANQAARVDAEAAKVKEGLAKMELESLSSQARALENITIRFGLDASSVETVKQQMADLAKGLSDQMTIQVKVVPPPEMGAPGVPTATGVEFPGYAQGGLLRGPGTGTSDSILMWGSNGEYMVRADAVRHYGTALLDQLNARRLPRFAEGGSIGGRSLPAIPTPAAPPAPAGGGNPVILQLPDGGTYTLQADNPTYDALVRVESRKYGRKRHG
ncbi:tape measure protein [Metapseudomonas furukawaii]|uniref:Phage tail length tape-measure protein n=1 Tax=Metapseudomonas furukawaii TaxID=1149133 RepID=A0AAD1C282_METFU|nr:tape measure protein [Pseudomonas furukawaii]ELS25682.1 Hypothetical protein ppKF707_0778 [Pseudomonas furukawaii]BAU76129.1 phage tail length tape-measure protein [Pseudomonas furukawaii]